MLLSRAHACLSTPTTPEIGLFDGIGPLEGARALVIGHGALEVVCGLIRRGCTAATEFPACGRVAPEADSVDVVIVPGAGSLSEAQRAIELAARALMLGGRIAVRYTPGGSAPGIAALMRAYGFGAVRTRPTPAGTVLTAERPIFGPLHRGGQC